MDELERLRQENTSLKKRIRYLENVLADVDKSSELKQHLEQCRRGLVTSRLINTVAGSQMLNIDAQQQLMGQLSIEKIELDARIEKATRFAIQDLTTEDNLAEHFNYGEVQGGIKIKGCYESCNELGIPDKIKGKDVVEIGEKAFEGMKFSKVRIPDSVRYIDSGAFENCKNLRGVILPQNLIFLGSSAFRETGLRELKFPQALIRIESMCFYGCKNLKHIALNEEIEYIGNSSFDCTDISSIIIPANVKEVAGDAIDGVSRVAVLGMKTTFGFSRPSRTTIYCLPKSQIQKEAHSAGILVKPLSEFRNI